MSSMDDILTGSPPSRVCALQHPLALASGCSVGDRYEAYAHYHDCTVESGGRHTQDPPPNRKSLCLAWHRAALGVLPNPSALPPLSLAQEDANRNRSNFS